MEILFLEKTISEEFKNLATELAKERRNKVTFITCDEATRLDNIKKLTFKPHKAVSANVHPYLKEYEEAVILAETAAGEAVKEQRNGLNPDVIFMQSSGIGMIMKEVFPNAKLISYVDWFNKPIDSVYDFGENYIDEDTRSKIKCDNTQYLIDLTDCDAAIAPSQWQKSLFPKEYLEKINIIHEGVDTNLFKPNSEAKFIVKETGIELTPKNEVLTFSTSGMGPLTGFPQFVEIVGKLFNKRPDLHFVISENEPNRDLPIENDNFVPMQLEAISVDKSRIHLVGKLPEQEFAQMLQISTAHAYLSYPLMFSNSCLKALSAGCCVIASDTKPVAEVIKNNENGFLTNFWDIDEIVEKIEYVFDNRDKMQTIKENARNMALNGYSKNTTISEKINLIKETTKK